MNESFLSISFPHLSHRNSLLRPFFQSLLGLCYPGIRQAQRGRSNRDIVVGAPPAFAHPVDSVTLAKCFHQACEGVNRPLCHRLEGVQYCHDEPVWNVCLSLKVLVLGDEWKGDCTALCLCEPPAPFKRFFVVRQLGFVFAQSLNSPDGLSNSLVRPRRDEAEKRARLRQRNPRAPQGT